MRSNRKFNPGLGIKMLFTDTMATKSVVLAITQVNLLVVPHLFKSYDIQPVLENCKIWEIARATSTASTFFAPINADGILLSSLTLVLDTIILGRNCWMRRRKLCPGDRLLAS